MEIRQLEHFVAVAEEEQFTRAAVRCNISQSALSASIRALEREMGVPLFLRTTRSVRLTDAGSALLDRARSVLDAMERAREAVVETSGRLGGTLSVGGIQTEYVVDQAKLLADFHRLHPDVEIRYATGTSVELSHALRVGDLDLAFVSISPASAAGVAVRELARHPMALICRTDHPLAGRTEVDVTALADETFIGGPNQSVVNDAIGHVYRVGGGARRLTLQVNDVHSMLDFVENGLGVALLPAYLIAARPNLVGVPLTDPTMVWTVGVITAPGEMTSRATRTLLAMVDDEVRN